MRAARLLEILLLLQNRGRMNSAQLADELEVSRRTILRDVDAMTEAGLPIIVIQGNSGGIELGFNYRTRLTGLAADEAEALAIILNYPMHEMAQLGMENAAHRARRKLIESLPDGVREKVKNAAKRFQTAPSPKTAIDPRIEAMVNAIRHSRIVKLNARTKHHRTVHPIGLLKKNRQWLLLDARNPDNPTPLNGWGDINISMVQFQTAEQN